MIVFIEYIAYVIVCVRECQTDNFEKLKEFVPLVSLGGL